MMQISTMRAVMATLDAEWESTLANAIIAHWQHDPRTLQFFRASANFLFMFTQAGKPYVLRFIHADERSADAILAEMAYLNHLDAQGISIARPVRSNAGRLVETVATELGIFHAVVFERLIGEQHELAELAPAQITRWGQALGALHNATQGYTGAGRPSWREHSAQIEKSLPPNELAARDVLHQLHEGFTQLPTDQHSFGLIHFDYELDNIIWQADRVGSLDFDDCAHYWYAADIAFAVRDAFDDSAQHVDLQNQTVQQFIAGYRSVRSIAQEELERIPMFLTWHNLLAFVRLQHSLGVDPPPDEVAWIVDLRQKFHRKMDGYRAAFGAFSIQS